MPTCTRAAAALIVALAAHPAAAATAESPKAEPPKTESTKADRAKADENRKKPLQRCDQLADKAQQDCLQKARQNIVDARKKREAAGDKGRTDRTPAAQGSPARDASAQSK